MTEKLTPYIAILIFFLILALGGVFTYRAMLNPDELPPFGIRQYVPQDADLFEQLGLDPIEFEVDIPGPSKVTFWVETYVNSKMLPDASFGYSDSDPTGFVGKLSFVRYKPVTEQSGSSNRVAWIISRHSEHLYGPGGEHWIDDPFTSPIRSSGSEFQPGEVGRFEWGVETRLYTIQQPHPSSSGRRYYFTEPDIIANSDRAVFLKTRIDPLLASYSGGMILEEYNPAAP